MRNKILESIYEKILLREQENLKQSEMESDEKSDAEREFEIFDGKDDIDPLDENDVDSSDKALKELIAAIQHLLVRYQNVIDGAKTEKGFMKELQHLIPIIRTTLNRISL